MLSLLSKIYGLVVRARNALYDSGVFEIHDLGARTISVGNITTGGTGKTPLVSYIAEVLAERGEKVCILTRGYGRENAKQRVLVSDGEQVLADAATGGDEPIELARKLLGKAIVISDTDRVSAAEWAKRRFGITTFILDDGFQHRRAVRDLDIVCIDATNPFGGGEMLPAGRLREPIENLARADCVVITKTNLVADISNLKSEIQTRNSRALLCETKNIISGILPIEEFHAQTRSSQRQANVWRPIEQLESNLQDKVRLAAFCALGNPDSFFSQLVGEFEKRPKADFDLAIAKPFTDHHVFEQKDIDELEEQAKRCRIDAVLTTVKDAVKLSNLKFEIPCFVIEIKLEIDDRESIEVILNS
jgi:tetraacyldisaccharide 4'-kinase